MIPAPRVPLDYPSQTPTQHGPPTLEPPERPYKAILVIAIILVAIGLVAYVYLPTLNNKVNVTEVTVSSADNACGLNGTSWGGLSAPLGATIGFDFAVNNDNSSHSCTISAISALTVGFSVSSANVPMTVPADSLGEVSFAIAVPAHPYSGALLIDVE